jgi:hypothetical protein
LISGGYGSHLDNSTPPRTILDYHDDTEIFDPQTGTFTLQAEGPSVRRASHTALPISGLHGAGVLLAGGEGPSGTSGAVMALKHFDLFVQGSWTKVVPPAGTPSRSHHGSAVDLATGYVVLLGGQAGPDTGSPEVFNTATFYDPGANLVKDVNAPLRSGRVTEGVAVARANIRSNHQRGGVALVGGRDNNGNVLDQISGLFYLESAHDYVDDDVYRDLKLPTGRAHHVAVRMRDDTILTAGGVTALSVTAFDYSNATSAVTIIDPIGGKVENLKATLSQARADSCAAVLEDGTALIAGGAWKDASAHSARQVDLVSQSGEVRSPIGPFTGTGDGTLAQARHKAACLRLKDGTVLVTGGLQFKATGGSAVALDGAEIYTPPSSP